MEIWTGSSRRRSKQDFRENRPNYPNYPTVFVPRCALCTVTSQSNTLLGAHVDNPIKARFQAPGRIGQTTQTTLLFSFRGAPFAPSHHNQTPHWELTSTIQLRQDFRENRPNYPNYPTVFVSRCTLCTIASQSNTPSNEKSNTTSPVLRLWKQAFQRFVHPTPMKAWHWQGPWYIPPRHLSQIHPPPLWRLLWPWRAAPQCEDPRCIHGGVDVSPSFGIFDISHPLVFAFAVPSDWVGVDGLPFLSCYSN